MERKKKNISKWENRKRKGEQIGNIREITINFECMTNYTNSQLSYDHYSL